MIKLEHVKQLVENNKFFYKNNHTCYTYEGEYKVILVINYNSKCVDVIVEKSVSDYYIMPIAFESMKDYSIRLDMFEDEDFAKSPIYK